MLFGRRYRGSLNKFAVLAYADQFLLIRGLNYISETRYARGGSTLTHSRRIIYKGLLENGERDAEHYYKQFPWL